MSEFRLSLWEERFRPAFAAMHADERVMADYGGPIDQSTSDAKFDRYAEAWLRDGIGRWAIEDEGGNFLGYAGIMAQSRVCGDSQSCVDVIHALDGSRRTDGCPMGEDRAALPWQADRPWA